MTVTGFAYKKDEDTFIVNILVKKKGILGDGQVIVKKGESLFDKVPFEDLVSGGIYDKSGKFLGTNPLELENR